MSANILGMCWHDTGRKTEIAKTRVPFSSRVEQECCNFWEMGESFIYRNIQADISNSQCLEAPFRLPRVRVVGEAMSRRVRL
jgi:hypothetical protein